MLMQDPLEIKSSEASKLKSQPITTAADLILYYLEQIGVEYVFGIPGGGIEPLYDALARSQRRGGPRAVVARHETGAAFMADGYARESGKLGVCCATTGPGATNMITGVASAFAEHIPLLAITAQASIRTWGKGAAQDSSCTGVNTVAMYESCTIYNTMVSHADQLEHKLISAITSAFRPPFGPAHISIPIDILREKLLIEHRINIQALLSQSPTIEDEAIDRLHHILYSARKIVFLLGADAWRAADIILELAVATNAQVITSPAARGLVSSFHPQYRGTYGMSGHCTAHALARSKHVDLFLVIGFNFDEFATHGWESSELLSSKAVFIDTTPQYFSRIPVARMYISGNYISAFEKLLARFQRVGHVDERPTQLYCNRRVSALDIPVIPFERRANSRRRNSSSDTCKVSYIYPKERRHDDRRTVSTQTPFARRFALIDEEKYLSTSTPIKPQRLMYDLSRLFPPSTLFLVDNGNSAFWAIHYLHPMNRRMIGRRPPNSGVIRFGMGFLSMGWAIGASIGTALASNGRPVVCITGDGALLMSGQELSVAVRERLTIIYVVLNDAALGTVKHGQKIGGAEPIGFELPNIDFAKCANAMGAESYSIHSPQDIAAINIARACTRQGPTLLDVYIDSDETPPIESRVKMLSDDNTKI